MQFLSRFLFLASITAGLLTLGACDTFNSGIDSKKRQTFVAGFYEAETLTIPTDSGTVDVLAKGASLEMRLQPDSTVEDGLLFVPAEFTEEDTEGSARIEFAGTWSRPSDSTVTFQHEADTFIRDTKWRYKTDTLRAGGKGGEIVLVRREDAS